MIYHTIIIGGSYAGLAAALALGRSLRNVLVIDAGKPCNRFTDSAHNFLSRDGTPPADLARAARQDVARYETVRFVKGLATALTGEDRNFTVTTETGDVFRGEKILFATGMRDLLLPVPGLLETWGNTTVHCPYCHGYELRGRPTGLLLNDDMIAHFYPLITNLTDHVELFTNGPAAFDTTPFRDQGIHVWESPVARMKQTSGQLESVVLEDGTVRKLTAFYLPPPNTQNCPLPEQLGCELSETGHLQTDAMQATTVPGVYAAGDCTTRMRSLHLADGIRLRGFCTPRTGSIPGRKRVGPATYFFTLPSN